MRSRLCSALGEGAANRCPHFSTAPHTTSVRSGGVGYRVLHGKTPSVGLVFVVRHRGALRRCPWFDPRGADSAPRHDMILGPGEGHKGGKCQGHPGQKAPLWESPNYRAATGRRPTRQDLTAGQSAMPFAPSLPPSIPLSLSLSLPLSPLPESPMPG